MTQRTLQELFESELNNHKLKGCYGVTSFKKVFSNLMPLQQAQLKQYSGKNFKKYYEEASFISLAFAFPYEAIQSINVKKNDNPDLEKWNYYSKWYNKLNQALNKSSFDLAEQMEGISIPATLGGLVNEVKHVEDYYSLCVSHRVSAELSGVGWRGKNSLIVNPIYSCAIRLASVIIPKKIPATSAIKSNCLHCEACVKACSFIRHMNKLENYREQCRIYISALGLDEEVCGKCIKACLLESIYSKQFKLC